MIIDPCMCAKSIQSCLTLCDPMHYSPPGSSVHGIYQARILDWAAIISSPGDLPDPGIEPMSPALAGGLFTTSATWEAPYYRQKPLITPILTSHQLASFKFLFIHLLSTSSSMWDLRFPTRDGTTSLQRKCRQLTTGPPGNSPTSTSLYWASVLRRHSAGTESLCSRRLQSVRRWWWWTCKQDTKPADAGTCIRSHHFMANRWGNNGNSDRLYFLGLQNHCRCWLQPWN